jgi:hypothetical protein
MVFVEVNVNRNGRYDLNFVFLKDKVFIKLSNIPIEDLRVANLLSSVSNHPLLSLDKLYKLVKLLFLTVNFKSESEVEFVFRRIDSYSRDILIELAKRLLRERGWVKKGILHFYKKDTSRSVLEDTLFVIEFLLNWQEKIKEEVRKFKSISIEKIPYFERYLVYDLLRRRELKLWDPQREKYVHDFTKIFKEKKGLLLTV